MNAPAQVLLFDQKALTPGEKLAQIWQAYKQIIANHQKTLNDLAATERSLFPGLDHYSYVTSTMSDNDLEKNLAETARDIRQRLAWTAAREFAPAGSRVEIDEGALADAFPVDSYSKLDGEIAAFDPVKVWDWLAAKYGGEAGQKLAYQQLAGRLRQELGLYRQDEIVMKGGYVVLSMTAWTDSYSSKTTYSYSTTDSIRKRLLALSEVAEWMERHFLSRDLCGHVSRMGNFDKVVSREKFGFGENGAEVLMITFKTSVEYRLRGDFAEQMQIFLGTYGNHEE